MEVAIRWSFFRYLINPEAMSSASFLITTLTLLLSSTALADLQQAPLLKPYEAPIVINGENVGSIKLPVGAQVEIISDQGSEYTVSRGGQIPFKIPKDYIVASTTAVAPAPPRTPVVINSVAGNPAPLTAPPPSVVPAKQQPQTLMEQVMAFLTHAQETAVENFHYLCSLLGISSAPRAPKS